MYEAYLICAYLKRIYSFIYLLYIFEDLVNICRSPGRTLTHLEEHGEGHDPATAPDALIQRAEARHLVAVDLHLMEQTQRLADG